MGRLAVVTQFLRETFGGRQVSEVVSDPGAGADITSQMIQPSGFESQPLPEDYVHLTEDSGSGRELAAGFVDAFVDPVTEAGEVRVYSRNGSGGLQAWARLNKDGTGFLGNANGGITLNVNGSVTINGITFSSSGQLITGVAGLEINGVQVAGHDHLAGTPPGDTGPMKDA